MLGVIGLQLDAGELGDAVDELADLRAEQPLDFFERRGGVLDRVVEQPGGDRGRVELHLGQDARDPQRMGEIGVARGALLRTVRFHRKHIGAVEEVLIRTGIVGPDALDQLELPDHRNTLVEPSRLDGPLAGAGLYRLWRRRVCDPRSLRRRLLPLPKLLDFAHLDNAGAILLGTGLDLLHALGFDGFGFTSLGGGGLLGDAGELALDRAEGRFLLRLVHLDVLLQGLNQEIMELRQVERAVRDLAERDHRILVIVPVHGQGQTGMDVASPPGRKHDQSEPIGKLIDAILYRNARHLAALFQPTVIGDFSI